MESTNGLAAHTIPFAEPVVSAPGAAGRRGSATSVEIFAEPDALPSDCNEILNEAAARAFFSSIPWYRNVLEHGMTEGDEALFAVCRDEGRPAAIVPLQRCSSGKELRSLTTVYSCEYEPIIGAHLNPPAIERVGHALGRFVRDWPFVRLDSMAENWAPRPHFIAGLRRAGILVRTFAHFGNWHEPVRDFSWPAYLASRTGELRTTIKRKTQKFERQPGTAIDVIEGALGVEAGIDAFESVYGRSWKEPEPFPRFNAGLIRRVAEEGRLRLGICRIDGVPVAVQLWVLVGEGRAMVLKLAHDEAFKAASPGTVLTASMIRLLLERDRVTDIDFGRGDDPYKQLWATQRRQRIGFLLVNPRRVRGLTVLGRQVMGRGRGAARAWLAGRSR